MVSINRLERLPTSAHILMCSDPGYFQHLAVCLSSLAESNLCIDFDVVILITRYTDESAAKLRRSLEQYYNITLRLIKFDESSLDGLPLTPYYNSAEIYARFWVADYFDEKVTRVIYLDGDIVVVGSLQELLIIPLHNAVLAAVSIPGSQRPAILGYDPADEYFNSGVMVINLKRWRDTKARERLVETSYHIAHKLNDPDQDVLNYCFHGERVRLDYVWNVITPFFRKKSALPLAKDEIERVVREARIIHFNGCSKPWQYLCQHPLQKEYTRHLDKTEWRNFCPIDYNTMNVVKRFISAKIGESRAEGIGRIFWRLAGAVAKAGIKQH